jgi:transposase
VKGRKRHILIDTLGLLVANRVEPADTSDRRAGALLLGGLSALFPRIQTVIADAGHESRKLARTLKQHQGWQLRIVKRRQRAFKMGLAQLEDVISLQAVTVDNFNGGVRQIDDYVTREGWLL